jgi:hypothetical protein
MLYQGWPGKVQYRVITIIFLIRLLLFQLAAQKRATRITPSENVS